MLKNLLSDNRIFGAIVCLLVFIAGGLLYLQVVKSQARRDVQRTQERLKQRSTPQTGEAEPQSAEGGHYHADGTYHVGSHEAETPSVSATPATPQSREAVNSAQVRTPVTDVAAANPSQQPTQQPPASTPMSETDRLQVLRDIRKTLPSHAAMTDIVAASEFVPSKDEVAVMSDDELMALYEDSTEKSEALKPEAWKRFSENVGNLEYWEPLMYEWLIHDVTARRALDEVSRRTNASIAKFPPGTIQLQLQREAERAAREERP